MGLSIIIPVYNGENYIKKCIDSILEQKGNYAIQIIIVDDGSTDRSYNILNEIRNKNKSIEVYHISNSGVSHARNIGMIYAIYEYIWFVDVDDYLEFGIISKIFSAITNSPDMLAISYIKESVNGHKESIIHNHNYFKYFIRDILLLKYDASVWQFIFKKSYIQNMSFNENLAYSEDTVFLIRVLKKEPYIECINDIGYHYLINQSGAVSTFSEKRISTFYAIDEIEKYIDSDDIDYELFKYYKAKFYFFLTIEMIKNGLDDNKYSIEKNRTWLKKNRSCFFIQKQGKKDSILFYGLISPFYRIVFHIISKRR